MEDRGLKFCNRETNQDSGGNMNTLPTLREYAAMVFEKSTGLPDPNGRMPVQLSAKSEGKPISFF